MLSISRAIWCAAAPTESAAATSSRSNNEAASSKIAPSSMRFLSKLADSTE